MTEVEKFKTQVKCAIVRYALGFVWKWADSCPRDTEISLSLRDTKDENVQRRQSEI